jgi:cysteine synthase
MAVSYRYEKAYMQRVQRLISVVNKIFDYINQYENKKNAIANQVTLEVIRKTSKNYVMLLNYVIFKN